MQILLLGGMLFIVTMNDKSIHQRKCSVEKCEKYQYCKTWCKAHYGRWWKHGDPQGGQQFKYGCEVIDCQNKHHSSGFCQKHYARLKNNGSPTKLRTRETPKVYEENGCGYIELTKGKFTIVDPKDLLPLGGYRWCFSGCGYAITTIDGKIRYMHHLILPSRRGLVNDHINRNRLDNRRENLRYVTHGENVRNSFRCDKKS